MYVKYMEFILCLSNKKMLMSDSFTYSYLHFLWGHLLKIVLSQIMQSLSLQKDQTRNNV